MMDQEQHAEQPLSTSLEPPQTPALTPTRQRGEKEEKDEKGRESRSDALGGIIWAFILIAAGVIFLLYSPLIGFEQDRFGGAWNLVFVAVGLLLFLEVAIRLLVARFRRPVAGGLLFGFVMLAIGVSGITGWDITWPLFLIGFGVILLLSGLLKGRF